MSVDSIRRESSPPSQNWAFRTPAACMRSHLRGPLFTCGHVVLDHIAVCARAWPQVLTNGAPGWSGVPGSAIGEISTASGLQVS